MQGLDLIEVVLEMTGLPQESLRREFAKLLVQNNKCPETFSLEDLRQILTTYLQDAILQAKDHQNSK